MISDSSWYSDYCMQTVDGTMAIWTQVSISVVYERMFWGIHIHCQTLTPTELLLYLPEVCIAINTTQLPGALTAIFAW